MYRNSTPSSGGGTPLMEEFVYDASIQGIRRVKSATALGSLQNSNSRLPPYSELQLVSVKLREMQLEISRLNRKIKETESEEVHTTNTLARRCVLLCNIWLALLTFISRSNTFFRDRSRLTGFLGRLLVPHTIASKQTLSAFLYDAILKGAIDSLPFWIGYGFLVSFQAYKRNIGFTVSTLYSIYLAFYAKNLQIPNIIGMLFNVIYLVSRHYYLHGLLSFEWASHLH